MVGFLEDDAVEVNFKVYVAVILGLFDKILDQIRVIESNFNCSNCFVSKIFIEDSFLIIDLLEVIGSFPEF